MGLPPPKFPFHAYFWDTPNTKGFSHEEKGICIDLLCLLWKSENCEIPYDLNKIMEEIRSENEHHVKNVIKSVFAITPEINFTCNWLKTEFNKEKKKAKQRKDAGFKKNTLLRENDLSDLRPIFNDKVLFSLLREKSGGFKFLASKNTTDVLTDTIVSNTVATSNTNNTENTKSKSNKKSKERKKINYSEHFLELWKINPYGSKKKAFEEYKKVKHLLPVEVIAILRNQKKYSEGGRGREFRPVLPHLERWFKHYRWEDEIPEDKITRQPVRPTRN